MLSFFKWRLVYAEVLFPWVKSEDSNNNSTSEQYEKDCVIC